MSLIDRYTHAVTTHLPQSQRADVAEELRTTIEDMVAARAKGKKPTETDTRAVLQELGDPTVLAHRYTRTKQYLIGPKWYDTYSKLLKQLLYLVPPIVAAVVLAVDVAQGADNLASAIVHAAGVAIAAGIQIAFWLTLVFVCLERFVSDPKELGAAPASAWTPDQLPAVPGKRQVGLGESMTSVALIVAGVAWVALTPVINTRAGESLFNPGLGDVWVWLFFVLAGLLLVHRALFARAGNWTKPFMVTNVLLNVAWIAYVLALITSQEVINPAFLDTIPPGDNEQSIHEAAAWVVSISGVAAVTIYTWDAIQSVILHRQLKK